MHPTSKGGIMDTGDCMAVAIVSGLVSLAIVQWGDSVVVALVKWLRCE